MFSFSELRIIALILLVITIFMFLPINISKKNRMYKVIKLVGIYLYKRKKYIYYKLESEGNNVWNLQKNLRNIKSLVK